MTVQNLNKEIQKGYEEKKREVQEIKDLFKKNKTLMLVSTKNLPDKQLQLIKKSVREKAIIKMYKKNILIRAFEELERVKEIEKDVKENIAVVFSQEDLFRLSLIFLENKNPVKAKAGQIVETDIFVEAGPTEFLPGPIISELNNAKIKFIIENGKISIKERSLIAKRGEVITLEKSSIMDKLGLKPFYIGLSPVSGYDKDTEKIYRGIKFSKEEIIINLKEFSKKSISFAFNIGYVCKATISSLIHKSVLQKKAISKKIEEKTNQPLKEDTGKKEEISENEDQNKKNNQGG